MSVFECETCLSDLPIKNMKLCPCGQKICRDCHKNKKDIITLNEWLINVPNRCEKCEKICCSQCIRTCYNCQNEGRDFIFTCIECSGVIKSDCEYHTWYICENCNNGAYHGALYHDKTKPKKFKCPECRGNKNYDRYGI